MIGHVPIVSFDTSAHNRLVDDGSRSEALLAGINSGLWFRFAGLSVEELFACPDPDKRAALFGSCQRIQRGPSECLLSPNLLIEKLVLDHFNNPKTFNWKTVNVRWLDCEKAISNPKFFAAEQVSMEQREFLSERKRLSKLEFASLRPEIQGHFERHGELPPTTFRPAISRLEEAEGGSVWAMAHRYYDLVTTMDTDEATVKEFMDVCPPFRSLVYARFIPWYNRAVRDYSAGERLSAGSNDLFMSVYLPYCDQFVTAEKNREQEKCLREVAAVAGLDTEILSYDDFFEGFLVTV
jgi:hypothetical protein